MKQLLLSLSGRHARNAVFACDCLSRASLTFETGVFLHVIIDGFEKLRETTEEPVLMRDQIFYEMHVRHLNQSFTAVFAEVEYVFGQ